MIVCRFTVDRREQPAITGVIHTLHDKYVHGYEAPTNARGDPSTLPNCRRVPLRHCTSITSHAPPDFDRIVDRSTECFVHNALYIKQRNRRVCLDDYRLATERRCDEQPVFTPSTDRLAGFFPFMRCLRSFIDRLARDTGPATRPEVQWQSLWMDQMYTADVPANERALHHCMARSFTTKATAEAAMGLWRKHKARWFEEVVASSGAISCFTHLVAFDGRAWPFLVALTAPGDAEDATHIRLDADSTCMHGHTNSKWETLIVVRMDRASTISSIARYDLRLEVRINLPDGFRIVDDDSESYVTGRLRLEDGDIPLVAIRHLNDEWFIGEVVQKNRDEQHYTILYATFLPEYVSETVPKSKLPFSTYKKDWVLVEKTTE